MKIKLAILICVVAGTIGALWAPPAAAADVYPLKISTFEPIGNHYTIWLQAWAETLNKRSGGRLKVEVFPSNQMGSLPHQFDLARTGVADMSFAMHGGTPGRFPLSELSHVAFLIPNAEVGSEALTSLLPGYLDEEYESVHVLCLTTTTPLALVTTKVAVRRPEDLKGLRIRHPDTVAAATLSALGAVPVYTEPAQIADALNKGTIDGALLAWEALESFQISARYVTDWGGNVTTFVLAMNRTAYDRLPTDLKKLIDDTTGLTAAQEMGKATDKAALDGRVYARKNKMEIIDLSPDERKAFETATSAAIAKLVADQEQKGLKAAQFFKALKEKVALFRERQQKQE
jgi:TRAP-type C4-dicarboxylate transport system substrate-binding protein